MFNPKFKISNQTANAPTSIERARGFLGATSLSQKWLEKMQNRALGAEISRQIRKLVDKKMLISEQDSPRKYIPIMNQI